VTCLGCHGSKCRLLTPFSSSLFSVSSSAIVTLLPEAVSLSIRKAIASGLHIVMLALLSGQPQNQVSLIVWSAFVPGRP
jgi:hypothetical protein